jgi:NAD(P)H-flavin reductase
MLKSYNRDYFIAALSLYAASLTFSFLRTAFNSLNAEAKFLLLSDSTVRVTLPTKMSWKAGQHAFLKFYASGGHWYTFHPFTICSLPSSGEMVFYLRPHKGITGALKDMIETKFGTMPMSIDGPYGNRDVASTLATHENVMLIAGGSGTGFLFPIIESLLLGGSNCPDVHMVMAIRNSDSASWIVGALERVIGSKNTAGRVKIHIQITDEGSTPRASRTQSLEISSLSDDNDLEKTATNAAIPVPPSQSGITVVQGQGRPDLKELIRIATQDGAKGTSVGITACGPPSMMLDVRNGCAEAQTMILKGNGGATEVWLHTEAFSW